MDREFTKRQKSIEKYLEEEFSDADDSDVSDGAKDKPYFSGLEDSDDTDADPTYEPDSDHSDSSDEDDLQRPNAELGKNAFNKTMDHVIETSCFGSPTSDVASLTEESFPPNVNQISVTPPTDIANETANGGNQTFLPAADQTSFSACVDGTLNHGHSEALQYPVENMDIVEDDTIASTIEQVINTYCHGPLPQPPAADNHLQRPLYLDDTSHPNLVVSATRVMKGKNGKTWKNKPSEHNTRAAARNIVHIRQGPKGNAKNKTTPFECFSLFFSETMKGIIIQHTNECIQRQQKNYSKITSSVSETNREEFDAFLGILILSAAQKDNHLNIEELFNSEFCGERYKAAMSAKRFSFLLNSLRFDAQETRAARMQEDRFAPIRDIWNLFIDSCKDHYKPGSYTTIDEQLLAFRGRCKFRMYMPNKPSKYGIKIVMLCDTSTKYMYNAIPYLGKGTTPKDIPQAMFFVKELTAPIHGSNRNVTVDNWFTSVPLAEEMLAPPISLTIVGTLRRDKPEIPPQMKDPGTRKVGTSMFCFDGQKTIVSYKTKNNKVVLLLSTTHSEPTINDQSKKPEIIECYNCTKGAVDALDQMCGQMSASRKTRRWPLCVFYGMINITLVNSYVIYVYNTVSKGEKPLSRRQFAKSIHCELVKPWMEHRLQVPNMNRPLRQIIASILQVDTSTPPNPPNQNQGRKICHFCPSKKRRMTSHFCSCCSRAMCGEHQAQWCKDCVN